MPNRHAYDLSLFAETIQATLNRNKGKGPLEDMDFLDIHNKAREELQELYFSMGELEGIVWESPGQKVTQQVAADVEREAADVAVCALAAFIKARDISRRLGGSSNG